MLMLKLVTSIISSYILHSITYTCIHSLTKIVYYINYKSITNYSTMKQAKSITVITGKAKGMNNSGHDPSLPLMEISFLIFPSLSLSLSISFLYTLGLSQFTTTCTLYPVLKGNIHVHVS